MPESVVDPRCPANTAARAQSKCEACRVGLFSLCLFSPAPCQASVKRSIKETLGVDSDLHPFSCPLASFIVEVHPNGGACLNRGCLENLLLAHHEPH